MSDLSRKTFSIFGLDTFCPLQLIAKSEKVRIIKSLFIDVCSLFMLCRQLRLQVTMIVCAVRVVNAGREIAQYYLLTAGIFVRFVFIKVDLYFLKPVVVDQIFVYFV